MRTEFPWRGLRATIRRPDFHALVLTATDMTAGNSVNFVDSWHHKGPGLPGGLHLPDPSLRVVHTSLRVEHCLASCAIPFLFPPISVDGRLMIDGSVRQNTPLAPALRMGATRILVVGVKRPHGQRVREHKNTDGEEMGFAQLAGKTLNAMMLDPIERDLQLVALFNEILAYGEEAFGAAFIEGLNDTVGKKYQTVFRPIETLEIRSSLDLGAVAAEAFQENEVVASRPTRMLLQAVANRESPSEADLLSYLLFDKSYTAAIEQLGFEDARFQQKEIARFLQLGQASA